MVLTLNSSYSNTSTKVLSPRRILGLAKVTKHGSQFHRSSGRSRLNIGIRNGSRVHPETGTMSRPQRNKWLAFGTLASSSRWLSPRVTQGALLIGRLMIPPSENVLRNGKRRSIAFTPTSILPNSAGCSNRLNGMKCSNPQANTALHLSDRSRSRLSLFCDHWTSESRAGEHMARTCWNTTS